MAKVGLQGQRKGVSGTKAIIAIIWRNDVCTVMTNPVSVSWNGALKCCIERKNRQNYDYGQFFL